MPHFTLHISLTQLLRTLPVPIFFFGLHDSTTDDRWQPCSSICWKTESFLCFLDHSDAVEIVVSFQAVPWAVAFGCQVICWTCGCPGEPPTLERGAGAETFTIAAGSINLEPCVVAIVGSEVLGGAHA